MNALLTKLTAMMAFDRAVEILGSAEQATKWMQCPDDELGARPIDLVETERLVQVMYRLRALEIDLCRCA